MNLNPICHPSPGKKMKCSFLEYIELLIIGWMGRWTRTPSATPLQPKKWNAHFWVMFSFWWSAGLVNGFKPHPPPISSQKNEMLIFGLLSISGDQPGWSMDSNAIHHPSPAKEWNAHFWITFNFWWSVGLVNGLESHLPPLSKQKNDMLIFVLRSTSDDWPGWSMDSNPIHLPSQAKEWNAHFWITFNFWWLAGLVDGLEPHPPPLSRQKNEMLIFVLCSTSGDQPGWSMDSNTICYPSPAKKMKCLFLYYVQLLVISRAGWWTQTPSATPLKPKKWNAHFCITFNFWWLAGLVIELKPHPPPLSSQKKNEMLIFGLHLTSDDQPGWSMDPNPMHHPSLTKKMKYSFLDYIQLLVISRAGWWSQTPSATPLQPRKWNAHFWITFNFWWSIRLVNGLEPHLPPLSNQKNDMLIFGLRSTSYDWLGWSMDSNPICNLFSTKKWNACFCITL